MLQLEAMVMIILLELEKYAKRKVFQNFALKAFCIEVTTYFFFRNILSPASKRPYRSHIAVQKLLYIFLFLHQSLLSVTKLGFKGLWMTASRGSFKMEIFNTELSFYENKQVSGKAAGDTEHNGQRSDCPTLLSGRESFSSH